MRERLWPLQWLCGQRCPGACNETGSDGGLWGCWKRIEELEMAHQIPCQPGSSLVEWCWIMSCQIINYVMLIHFISLRMMLNHITSHSKWIKSLHNCYFGFINNSWHFSIPRLRTELEDPLRIGNEASLGSPQPLLHLGRELHEQIHWRSRICVELAQNQWMCQFWGRNMDRVDHNFDCGIGRS